MADSGAWYLKMNDGTIYGPADLNRLQAWARGGRVAPSGQISSDLKSWVPASQMPELGMEWLVEVEQGQYYGPFHPDVIRDLIAQKRIPASARRFRLDTGRAQEDHSKSLNVALEKANALVVERESALEKATASLAEKDAALAELKAALAEQKTLVAGLRGQEAGLAAKLEMSLDESRSATAASALRIGELEAALKTEYAHAKELEAALTKSKSEAAASLVRAEELGAALKMERVHVSELGAALENARSEVATGRTRCDELSSKLEESKSAAAASASRIEELGTALDAEHVRVENLLAQLVAAAEREKALRTDLDLARKTAASERKCVEAAIRKQRQTEKELEGARKDAEDLRVKVQKAKEQSKAAKGKGGLFQGASAADLAFLEQAARRELASARGRSASVPRPRSKALDVIDV